MVPSVHLHILAIQTGIGFPLYGHADRGFAHSEPPFFFVLEHAADCRRSSKKRFDLIATAKANPKAPPNVRVSSRPPPSSLRGEKTRCHFRVASTITRVTSWPPPKAPSFPFITISDIVRRRARLTSTQVYCPDGSVSDKSETRQKTFGSVMCFTVTGALLHSSPCKRGAGISGSSGHIVLFVQKPNTKAFLV